MADLANPTNNNQETEGNGGAINFPRPNPETRDRATPPTQATRIPAKLPDRIDGLSEKLAGRQNYEIWEFYVKNALQSHGIQDVIDYHLPRPNSTSSTYPKWEGVSLTIRSWLMLQLNKNIVQQLLATTKPTKYADDAFKTIKDIVLGHGHTLARTAYVKALDMKRSQYATISQFASEFRDTVSLSNKLGCPISPYCAVLLLLRELEPEMPNWAAFVELRLPSDAALRLQDNDFLNLVGEAIEKGNDLDQRNSAASATSVQKGKAKENNNSKSSSDENAWKKASWPSKGTSYEDHAEKLRNQKAQRHEGNCGYCRQPGHTASKCYYLNPDLRPDDWTPIVKRLWAWQYYPKGQPTKDQANSAVVSKDDANEWNFGGMAIALQTPKERQSQWIYDTGASEHLTPDRDSMMEYKDLKPHEAYKYGTSNGDDGVSRGIGYINVSLDTGVTMRVQAYYNPNMKTGLFSAEKAKQELGIYWSNKDNTIRSLATDEVVGYTQVEYGVPFIKLAPVSAAMSAVDPMILHRRLGHAGFRKVISTAKGNTIELEDREDLHCDACQRSKSKRLVSRDPIYRTTDPGELWYADVQKISPTGFGGYNYALIMVNDATRLVRTAMLHDKKDASPELIKMNTEHHNITGRYVSRWRLDGGNEFQVFKKWANEKERGIQIELTCPRTPEANGPAERFGGILNQMSRTMMIDSGLPPTLWPFAIETAAKILNRLIPPGSDSTNTPAYKYRTHFNLPNPDASLDFMRVYGCRAYIHVPKEDRVTSAKMEPRANIGYLVGFEGDNGHIFKIWMPDTNKIKRSRDVTFYEKSTYKDDSGKGVIPIETPPTPEELETSGGASITIPSHVQQPQPPARRKPEPTRTAERTNTLSSSADPINTIEKAEDYKAKANKAKPSKTDKATGTRISSRSTKGKTSAWLGDEQGHLAMCYDDDSDTIPDWNEYAMEAVALPRLKAHEIRIPNTYKEAMSSPLASYWEQAMDIQIAKIKKMNTYEIVKKPPGARVIPGKWVFDLKVDQDNYVTEFRARWVVCGNRQRPGVDYDQSYAPVAGEAALKMFLTAVAIRKLYWEQCDIISAYLHAQIKGKRVFMMQPTGYHEGSADDICLLLQALYGLRQAAFLWHQTFATKLREIGFDPIPEDACIFKRGSVLLAIYVDDSIIAAESKDTISEVKSHLADAFGLKELGEPTRFLGCNVSRDYEKHTISLDQSAYVEEILMTAGMLNCSGNAIPMNPGYRNKSRTDMTTENVDIPEYQTVLGRLNWLTVKTRPDVRYAVFILQRRLASPTTDDRKAVTAIIRYLKATHDYGVTLAADHDQQLEIYVDAAHQDHEDGKSTEGVIIKYAGAPIIWISRKQSLVAPSSTIAEFCAFDTAVKEALFIKKLAIALDLPVPDKIPIYTDSNNGLKILQKGTYTPTTRWLDNRYLFVLDHLDSFEFRFIEGSSNLADGLTKPLDRQSFHDFRSGIGIGKTHVNNTNESHDLTEMGN